MLRNLSSVLEISPEKQIMNDLTALQGVAITDNDKYIIIDINWSFKLA